MASPPSRKGRPLLVAAAGIAFVSFAGCRQPEEPRPVGNLRPVEPLPTQDAGETPPPLPSASASASAGGTGGGPAVGDEPPIAPVGNLRPPEVVKPDPSSKPSTGKPRLPRPKSQPVGNLRLPNQK